MTLRSVNYTHLITDVDRVKVKYVNDGKQIIKYSVQYEALINSRWHKVTRFDNAHGRPHRHLYYPNQPEHKYLMKAHDNNQALTEAQIFVKKNFLRMREAYILLIERAVGEE